MEEYGAGMEDFRDLKPRLDAPEPEQLLTTGQVREYLTAADPSFGSSFSDRDWGAVTERITALALLLWRVSQHEPVSSPDGRLVAVIGDADGTLIKASQLRQLRSRVV